MKTNKAFTLIEIMIVVVIIGILAVSLFPKLLGTLGKTADEARKVELKNWETILLDYKTSNDNTYPSSTGECLSPDSVLGKKMIEDKYVDKSKFPKDPNPKNTVAGCVGYFYYRSLEQNGISDNSFMILARMENDSKGNAGEDVTSVTTKESVENLLKTTGKYYVVTGQ